jgi:hypothetical protein
MTIDLTMDEIKEKVNRLKLTVPYLASKVGIKPNRLRFALYRITLTDAERHRLSLVVSLEERAHAQRDVTAAVEAALLAGPRLLEAVLAVAPKESVYAAFAILKVVVVDGVCSL